MKLFKQCDHYIRQMLLRREWKKAYALKRDYQVLSELARYLETALLDPKSQQFSDGDIHTLLYGKPGEVIKNGKLASIRTDFRSDVPETLGDFIRRLNSDDLDVFQRYLNARITNRLDLKNLKYIVFSGGGAKGLVYPGILKALQGKQLYNQIEEVSGTSAGALISLPIALGYTPDEIEEIVRKQNFGHFFDESEASSNGIVGKIVKQVMNDQDKAELEYLRVYSKSIVNSIVRYFISEDYPNDDEGRAEFKKRKSEIKAHMQTMTYGSLKSMASSLSQLDCAKDWIEEAESRAEHLHRQMQKNNPDIKPFRDFTSVQDAIEFSVRKHSNHDNILAFLQDMVEDKINSIPPDELNRALPDLDRTAREMLQYHTVKLLGALAKHSFDILSEETGLKKGSSDWKWSLISSIRQKDKGYILDTSAPGWSELKSLAEIENDDDMRAAVNVVARMSGANILGTGQVILDTKSSNWSKKNVVKPYISKLSYDDQKTLYHRNLNFFELNMLAERLPEYGFKKLHVSMCRYDKLDFKKILEGDLKGIFNKKFQLAAACGDRENRYSRMPISLAVRASMNLPIGFKPIEYDNERFGDGLMVSNLPTHPFMDRGREGRTRTLICMLGDNSFYRQGKTLKDAVRNCYVSGVALYDAMKPTHKIHHMLTKPLGILGAQAASWFLFKMNPSYKTLSHADTLRTLLLRSGEVGSADFGISEEEKNAMIQNTMVKTYQALAKGDDVQLAFLEDRMRILEKEMSDECLQKAREDVLSKSKKGARPGVFSRKQMQDLEVDMGRNAVTADDTITHIQAMRLNQACPPMS